MTIEISSNSFSSVMLKGLTPREIDVIACVLHSRGDKKIAAILNVSPRTVGAHLSNIMNKLSCNSKDQIIDFIEKSGIAQAVRPRYWKLLLESNFRETLSKLSKITRGGSILSYYKESYVLQIDPTLWNRVKQDLTSAGIGLKVVSEDSADSIQVIDLDDLTSESYYESFYQILRKIYKSANSENLSLILETIGEFERFYEAFSREPSSSLQMLDQAEVYRDPFIKKSKYIRASSIMSIAIFLGLVILYLFAQRSNPNEISSEIVKPEVITSLEELVGQLSDKNFSANNIDKDEMRRNHALVKKVEGLLSYANSADLQKYFAQSILPTNLLIDYLQNLHSLSSYYMYNKHDGQRAREILLKAKSLSENYVSNLSSAPIDFDALEPEEVIAEFDVAEHLAQIYTRIIYALGRTYVYAGNIADGYSYFRRSQSLGSILSLFESYLSQISGMLIIDKELVSERIRSGNDIKVQEALNKIIASYRLLLHDKNSYILDYTVGSDEQKKIVPADHSHNVFVCYLKILECYDLMIHTAAPEGMSSLIIELEEDMLYLLKQKDKITSVSDRKRADLYNCLANLLLDLEQKGAESDTILKAIAKLLDIESKGSLEIAEQSFAKAKSISRNMDFTKADAYWGLARVAKAKLDRSNLTSSERVEIEQRAEEYSKKSEEINKSLNRRVRGRSI